MQNHSQGSPFLHWAVISGTVERLGQQSTESIRTSFQLGDGVEINIGHK
jgi:hypothetical protein